MNDREKLIALLKENTIPEYWAEMIADHLIANGVVVREKGEWELEKYNAHCSCGRSYGTYHFRCTACNRVSYAQPYRLTFCPNCGADMRKVENG